MTLDFRYPIRIYLNFYQNSNFFAASFDWLCLIESLSGQKYDKYADDALTKPTAVAIQRMRERLIGPVPDLGICLSYPFIDTALFLFQTLLAHTN